MDIRTFSPRQFLRARRPERFSDSVVIEHRSLDRSLLEYQLDSLTSRSQETDFERFARQLAEKEICPNLLPHTGPTGGGDSKVDTETYPVADNLALAWYVGSGREAASERWAFAISAKKKWRAKVQADVAKIVATNRGYSKAFFITNQYVSDRSRAEVEDQLRNDYKIDVRILDRSWILDRVFKNGHESLAIDVLGLQASIRPQVRKGPLDLKKEEDLSKVETRITDAAQHGRLDIQFAADCVEAATLSRDLERPRTEVDNRFVRARDAADKYGTTHQKLVCAYQVAWTNYWWYEDYRLFSESYGLVESYAVGSQNAYDLELLTNLWFVLYSTVMSKHISEPDAHLDARTKTLTGELERLSKEQDRPSTALQAQTLRLQMRFLSSGTNNIENVLHEFKEVVEQCEGMIGYPLLPVVETLTELGIFLDDRPAYKELFEAMVRIIGAREGEIAAARLLLSQGARHLDKNRPYEAIRFLGRTLVSLYKDESRDDLVRALYLCAAAYEQVGLLWAARGTVLTAAAIATYDFATYSEVTPAQAACFNRMKWLELRLGRLPHVLAWHEVDTAVKVELIAKGYAPDPLSQGALEFDAILGMQFLRTEIQQLKQLTTLPDVLENLALYHSAIALRFALGHQENLPKELFGENASEDSIRHFFVQWRDQPAAKDLPVAPSLYEERKVTLTSNVLGCQIMVESENIAPCVDLAEWVLAAIESLLSTGMLEQVVAREPVMNIQVRKSDFGTVPFGFKMQDRDGRPYLEILCSTFDTYKMSVENQKRVKDRMLDLLPHIHARVFSISATEHALIKLFRDELALERSVNFTSSFVTLSNVLGQTPKTTMSKWSDPRAHDYPLARSEEWDAADRRAKLKSILHAEKPKIPLMAGEPPEEVLDMGSTKHSDIKTVSLIREVFWDKAGWVGMAFLWTADESIPPNLALVFRNGDAAGKIFAQWREELGTCDSKEQLRVTIIRGISKRRPHWYRVLIGVNPEALLSEPVAKRFAIVSRIHTMQPASGQNLDGFLSRYTKRGKYNLLHAVRHKDGIYEPIWTSIIEKHDLCVRNAWEIGMHDFDAPGIHAEDDPIIPPDQTNAPVLELFRWLREGPR